MSKYLWQSDSEEKVDETIMEFMAGEDVILDRELFPYDIRATAAHVRGLERIDILNTRECETLCALLDELLEEYMAGQFTLDARFEDGHSAIEVFLTGRAGDLGGKVHTGRSRNDQVAVATRLYLKDCLNRLLQLNSRIAHAALEQAEHHADIPMPGYTHLQRAVPSSIGLWMGGFAEAFTDNTAIAGSVLKLIDSSPLGTAAGYGVNLPLDRDGVASDLDFQRVQVNPLYTQNSRGKFEIMALQAVVHSMQDVRRLAWDLSLFTTSEFDFVSLPEQYTTGSSIIFRLPTRFAVNQGASDPGNEHFTAGPGNRSIIAQRSEVQTAKYARCDYTGDVRDRPGAGTGSCRYSVPERLPRRQEKAGSERGTGCFCQPVATRFSRSLWRLATGPDSASSRAGIDKARAVVRTGLRLIA
jgi:hypothetical protein